MIPEKSKEGMLFVAIAGTVVDGHKYIPDVVKKGASVLVVEKEIESIDESITVIRVANGRAALSLYPRRILIIRHRR